MKKFLFINLIIAGLILMSCGNNNKEKSTDVSENKDNEMIDKSKNESKGKYQIKSGIISYSNNVLGMKQETVITFDDYGNKEVTDNYTEAMGIKLHNRTIVKEGFSYNLNMDEKTGTKVKMLGMPNVIDYSNLSKEIEKKMNLKKIGTETILGKDCDIYSFDFKEMTTKGTTWIWKGIAFKSDVNSMGMDVKMTAIDFKENPSINQDVFEVPADFKIIEP